MKNDFRANIIIACVALVGTLGGAGVGSWMTGRYLLMSTRAQVDKDITVLSSQNAQKNMEKIREKAEAFLTTTHDVIDWFETHDNFKVSEAKIQIRKLEREAFAFVPYGNPKLVVQTLAIPISLRNAVEIKD